MTRNCCSFTICFVIFATAAAILDGNEYHGGRKKTFGHGLNQVLLDVDGSVETTILMTNDETEDSLDLQVEKKKSKFFKSSSLENEQYLSLPDRFSVLDFHTNREEDIKSYESGNLDEFEERQVQLAFWGRIYVEGFPKSMQYFRAHFGQSPPQGKVIFILADPRDMCNEDFEPALLNIDDIENVVIVTHRGNCSFAEKALLVSKVGASGILYVNSEEGNLHPSGPAVRDLKIYASMISKNDGLLLIDAFKDSSKVHGFYAPMQCVPGMCEPTRRADKEMINRLSFKGKLMIERTRILNQTAMDYMQGEFGRQVIEKKWILESLPNGDPFLCHKFENTTNTRNLSNTAILVKRGRCDFTQKAQGNSIVYIALF